MKFNDHEYEVIIRVLDEKAQIFRAMKEHAKADQCIDLRARFIKSQKQKHIMNRS